MYTGSIGVDKFKLGKIDCIKLIREIIPNCGLVESKELIEAFFSLFGVEAVEDNYHFNKFLTLARAYRGKTIIVNDGRLVRVVRNVVTIDNWVNLF